jgi:hypothetical protein
MCRRRLLLLLLRRRTGAVKGAAAAAVVAAAIAVVVVGVAAGEGLPVRHTGSWALCQGSSAAGAAGAVVGAGQVCCREAGSAAALAAAHIAAVAVAVAVRREEAGNVAVVAVAGDVAGDVAVREATKVEVGRTGRLAGAQSIAAAAGVAAAGLSESGQIITRQSILDSQHTISTFVGRCYSSQLVLLGRQSDGARLTGIVVPTGRRALVSGHGCCSRNDGRERRDAAGKQAHIIPAGRVAVGVKVPQSAAWCC